MRRILLVPESVAGILPAALRDRQGVAIRTAQPEEVVSLTASWPPQLVIMGPELGDEVASRLARALRADRRLSALRILLVSEGVPRGPAGPVVHADVDAHVVGPSPAELVRAVGVLLDISTRRLPRLAAEILARVTPERADDPAADPEPMLANVIALGETSCQLEAADPLPIGATIHIEMALPGGDPLRLHALVLSADELQLHHTCELLDDDPDTRARIRLFLAHVGAG